MDLNNLQMKNHPPSPKGNRVIKVKETINISFIYLLTQHSSKGLVFVVIQSREMILPDRLDGLMGSEN